MSKKEIVLIINEYLRTIFSNEELKEKYTLLCRTYGNGLYRFTNNPMSRVTIKSEEKDIKDIMDLIIITLLEV